MTSQGKRSLELCASLLLCRYSWMVRACDVSLLYSWLAKYLVIGKLRGDGQAAYA